MTEPRNTPEAVEPEGLVKPLEWEPVDAICTTEQAAALGGHYCIVFLDGKDGLPSLNLDLGGWLTFKFTQEQIPGERPGLTQPRKYESVEAAKLDAQADYTARILAALDLSALQAQKEEIERLRAQSAGLQSLLAGMAGNAETVMRYLAEDGARVMGHLLDTDDNPGQRLRDDVAEAREMLGALSEAPRHG